jgi:hypothetical protein
LNASAVLALARRSAVTLSALACESTAVFTPDSSISASCTGCIGNALGDADDMCPLAVVEARALAGCALPEHQPLPAAVGIDPGDVRLDPLSVDL